VCEIINTCNENFRILGYLKKVSSLLPRQSCRNQERRQDNLPEKVDLRCSLISGKDLLSQEEKRVFR
jgi:hypothetical protein